LMPHLMLFLLFFFGYFAAERWALFIFAGGVLRYEGNLSGKSWGTVHNFQTCWKIISSFYLPASFLNHQMVLQHLYIFSEGSIDTYTYMYTYIYMHTHVYIYIFTYIYIYI
jgi:hypothetical protein